MEHPEAQTLSLAPFGYDVHTTTHSHVVVTPRPAPPTSKAGVYWRIGPVTAKTTEPSPTPTSQSERRVESATESEFTVQLTADQQVALSISGEDAYGNPTDVTGDVAWWSSDEAIVRVFRNIDDNTKAIAIAVGPVGTAAVTVSNDFDQDGTGDFQGSIAIDVIGGTIAEITVNQGEVSAKPAPDNTLPTPEPGTPGEPPVVDNTLPGEQPVIDNSLPGEQPVIDNSLPVPPEGTEESPPRPDNTLPEPEQPTDPNAPHPDNTLPGDLPPDANPVDPNAPRPDQTLPGDLPS